MTREDDASHAPAAVILLDAVIAPFKLSVGERARDVLGYNPKSSMFINTLQVE